MGGNAQEEKRMEGENGRNVKAEAATLLNDEGEIEGFTDLAVGAPGAGQWVKEALGKDEKAEAAAREYMQRKRLTDFRATVVRISRLHKEIRYLQQKLGTAWFKEVAELKASMAKENSGKRPEPVRHCSPG